MSFKSTINKVAIALAVVPAIVLSGSALATVHSSIESGDIYRVKNETKGTDYADVISADKCDTLKYAVRIHNGGPTDVLNNVVVQAAFPTAVTTQNISLLIVRASNASPSSASDTATVNLSSAQKLTYVSGSTKLLDANGNLLQTLPDGIMGSGVSIGNVGISINEKRFVEFQEKVNCPETPKPVAAYSCDLLTLATDVNRTVKISSFNTTATNGAVFKNAVIDWGDNSDVLTTDKVVGQTHQYAKDGTYTVSAVAHFTLDGKDVTSGGEACKKPVVFTTTKPPVTPPATPPATTTPTPGKGATLVNTGPGSVAGLFLAVTAFGTFAHRWFLARRLSQQ